MDLLHCRAKQGTKLMKSKRRKGIKYNVNDPYSGHSGLNSGLLKV